MQKNTSFNRLLDRISQLPIAVLVVSMLFVQIIRTGIQRSDNIETYVVTAASFPEIYSYWRTSLFFQWIPQVFPLSTSRSWLVAYVIMTIFTLAMLILGIVKTQLDPTTKKLFLAIAILGPFTTILFTEIGRYDVFVLLGSVIAGLSGSVVLRSLGILIMLFGNFEQAIVAVACLLLVIVLSHNWKHSAKMIFSAVFLIFVNYLTLRAIYPDFSLLGGDTRSAWLLREFRNALQAQTASLPLLLISFYGVAWIFVVQFLLSEPNRVRQLVRLFSLVLIPGVATVMTFDGTRVFVCVSAAAFLHESRRYFVELRETDPEATAKVLLLSLIVPSISVQVNGLVRRPLVEIFRVLTGQ